MLKYGYVLNFRGFQIIYKYSILKLKEKACEIAEKARAPLVVLLHGDLGTGKTAFSQFFIGELLKNKRQSITSPTFNIVHIYDSIKGPIWHVDLYRIENTSEIEELSLLEAMHQYICLIEWPDLIIPYIKNCNVINVEL
ncbi:MAG: tRNA (adenosine(37)-N6)-threonylcarbamoyltransferase complex ATPase subunit type 1 TsaE [Holosporales bacterium]|jgi:tRNA threonylcarbamoyladenosine biosynthesis protein TsaE|nr:tRNA (adenosine(37)-N6)-threonylcarbamoyltransferase complex ATPase subunit type 1 TsaE [Holosporales bacterium]